MVAASVHELQGGIVFVAEVLDHELSGLRVDASIDLVRGWVNWGLGSGSSWGLGSGSGWGLGSGSGSDSYFRVRVSVGLRVERRAQITSLEPRQLSCVLLKPASNGP